VTGLARQPRPALRTSDIANALARDLQRFGWYVTSSVRKVSSRTAASLDKQKAVSMLISLTAMSVELIKDQGTAIAESQDVRPIRYAYTLMRKYLFQFMMHEGA
jgi:hypothetical protein